MKRISVLLLCAALTAGLCGCADSKSPSSPNSSSEPSSVSDASGGSSAAADIGPESAVDAALKHAGVDRSAVTFVRSKLDNENSDARYEIEFSTADTDYEYEINAGDGSVLKFSSESRAAQSSSQSDAPTGVTADEARAAALKRADMTEDEVTFLETRLDDDKSEYDIEFISNGFRYECEVRASDGTITDFSVEALPTQGAPFEQLPPSQQSSSEPPASSENTASSSSVPNGRITEDEARSIAARHAGYSAQEVTFVKTKLDYDDGIAEYDVEFTVGTTLYEYEIRESDGRVLEFSAEVIDVPTAAPSEGQITREQAKETAVKHAGFTADQVTFTKTELDYDDGRAVYEIEFCANGLEYELKIDASSGSVLEMEIDD